MSLITDTKWSTPETLEAFLLLHKELDTYKLIKNKIKVSRLISSLETDNRSCYRINQFQIDWGQLLNALEENRRIYGF